MPIKVEWYDPQQTFIWVRAVDIWSLEDFYQAFPLVEQYLQPNPRRIVGLLIDASESNFTPKNVMAGYKRVVINGKLPIGFINLKSDSRMMVESLRKAYQAERPIFYATSPAEAVELLTNHRRQSGLDDHPPDEN